MSEVKVNKISPRSGTDVTLGDSGDTFTVPTGVTLDTSNSTVTLPDSSVSLAKLTATGTKDATTFLRGDNTFAEAGGGIEMADQWRITADTSVRASEFLTANWERVDTTSAGFIGTGVTESSGVFTFPSTGIYLILATILNETNGSRTYSGGEIHVTTNNSTYTVSSQAIQSTDIQRFVTANPSFILDVTDTSNVKIKLRFISSGLDKTMGDTSVFKTGVSFIRLGDT